MNKAFANPRQAMSLTDRAVQADVTLPEDLDAPPRRTHPRKDAPRSASTPAMFKR